MKKTILIIFLTSLNLSAQKIFFPDFVECYYPAQENEPIQIYDTIKGNMIAELKPLSTKSWYKFAIAESKNGWLKIENIIILPNYHEHELNSNIHQYKGNWILEQKMKINIADLNVDKKNGVSFYQKPNSNSELIYQSGKFLRTDLIEIKGLWAKVSFMNNGVEVIGWLQRKDQCAYPWTSCPYHPD